jgi:hypothetical protein
MIKAYQTEFYGKFKTTSEIKNRKHFFYYNTNYFLRGQIIIIIGINRNIVIFQTINFFKYIL